MKRRTWIGAAVATAAAAAGAGWALRHRGAGDASPPGAAARFFASQFERPDGGMLAVETFRGRPLLLNFWATWCPPCVEEMPLLDAFHRRQPADGWQVLGLAVDRLKPVQDFLARTPMGFAIGMAGMEAISLTREFGNTGGGLPFSAAFDRQGKLVDTHLGALKATDLERWAAR